MIDFSRAILSPDFYDIYNETSIDGHHSLKNKDTFFKEQVRRLVATHVSVFPEYVKKQEELIVLANNYFDSYFHLMTVLDIYKFVSFAYDAFGRISGMPNLPIGHKTLLKSIIQEAKIYLTKEVDHMIEDRKYTKIVCQKEHPMLSIIKKVFAKYRYKPNDKHTCIESYHAMNDMKYAINDMKHYPPYFKFSYHSIIKRTYDISTKYEKERHSAYKLMYWIANRQKEKIF